MANAERLAKVLAVVEEREAEGADERGNTWSQGDWALKSGTSLGCYPELLGETCNTAMCFAGWTCALFPAETADVVRTMQSPYVDDVAAEVLDLFPSEATRLFEGANTIEDLRRIVDELS